ncbi:MAG TPA: phosphopyruvate hydratase [Isosphaeraceae bacterium]|jgi:enolase|nr:phosphopyruvate hydratase [Isosphaeraceae bacterium]
MSRLAKLVAREVLDSRGQPTVEVEASGDDGAFGRAIVPAGASTGRHEAKELRDADARRFGGRGVRRAVAGVGAEIAPAVLGIDLDDQAGLDARLVDLDGTPDKGRLGANAILGVSLAVAHAAAASKGEELYQHLHCLWRDHVGADAAGPTVPLPMINMISGGLHAGANLDFQDFLMVPVGAADFGGALEMASAVYRALGAILRESGAEAALVADEGGYGPKLRADCHAVERILEAVVACGLEPGRDVAIALDIASSRLFDPAAGLYRLSATANDVFDSAGMIDLLEHWTRQFPIASIEDGLAEDDWDGWAALTARLGGRVQLIGDDLFVTRTDRLLLGVERKVANAVLVKVNQVGTLTETFATLALARRSGYRAIVSARSGETEDATIADLAVAVGAGQIKIGSLARSERLAKYNRLLRITEHLGPNPPFAGRSAIEL